MSKQYRVSANHLVCGIFKADDEQGARDLAAQDAGYDSEADMVEQLEQDSELTVVDLAAEFGTVDFEGKTYTLTNQAQADNHGTEGLVRYTARAVDDSGHEYVLAWDTTDAWDVACKVAAMDDEDEIAEVIAEADLTQGELPDVSDESNACDWDSPVSVKAV